MVYGNYLKCNISESINHLALKCSEKGNVHDNYNNITLFESNLNWTGLKKFTGEKFKEAKLDYCASKTIYARTWVICCMESLSTTEKEESRI